MFSFFFLDTYPEVEFLEHMVVLFLVLWGTSILFSIVAASIYIVSNSVQVFPFLFFFKVIQFLFIYLFMAVLGPRFCVRAFTSCGKWGPLFIAVRGPFIIAASPVAEHRLQMRRLSNCGSRAQLLCGMWDPPRPGLEPVSPASAGRLLTLRHQGSPVSFSFRVSLVLMNS